MTICKKCKHCNIEREGLIWYDYTCGAIEKDQMINPVTGNLEPYIKNEKNEIKFETDKYFYCNELNKGNCEYYEGARTK